MPSITKIYIQQWDDFPCQEQIKHLNPITQEEILAVKKAEKGVGDEELL
jgi:hypothetical protein